MANDSSCREFVILDLEGDTHGHKEWLVSAKNRVFLAMHMLDRTNQGANQLVNLDVLVGRGILPWPIEAQEPGKIDRLQLRLVNLDVLVGRYVLAGTGILHISFH
jgi:hypothetical protein